MADSGRPRALVSARAGGDVTMTAAKTRCGGRFMCAPTRQSTLVNRLVCKSGSIVSPKVQDDAARVSRHRSRRPDADDPARHAGRFLFAKRRLDRSMVDRRAAPPTDADGVLILVDANAGSTI